MVKQKRPQKTSILLFGEGSEDQAVLAHIADLYINRSTHHVVPDSGVGGSPMDVLESTQKHAGFDYSHRLLILDGDRPENEYEALGEAARKKGFEFLMITPCMEALILSIIDPTKKWHTRSTAFCKSHLEKNFVEPRHRTLKRAYAPHVTKIRVDAACQKHSELHRIVSLVSGGQI